MGSGALLEAIGNEAGSHCGLAVHPWAPAAPGRTFDGLPIIEAEGVAVLADGSRVEVETTGKGDTQEARSWSAAMEVIERVAVLEARADARGAFNRLAEAAVPPSRMVLAPQPMDPDEVELDWSRARVCRDGREMLISRPVRGGAPGLFTHTTNGAAGGQDYLDALHRALLEVVERDAFLTTWYARRPAQGWARPFDDGAEPVAAWLGRHGFRVTAYRLQSDLKAPVFLALATQEAMGPICRGGVLAGASAGASCPAALKGALLEIVQVVESLLLTPPPGWNLWPGPLRHFAASDRREEFAFLDQPGCPPGGAADAGDAFALIEALASHGFDAFAVDRTPPWMVELGLAVVETQVPGLQPLILAAQDEDRIAWGRFSSEERPSVRARMHPLG